VVGGSYAIAGFQSRDYDDMLNSDGGQGVKSSMDDMEESTYYFTHYYKRKI